MINCLDKSLALGNLKIEMLKLIVLLNIIVLVVGNKSPHGEEYLSKLTKEELDAIPKDIAEDALLDVEGLITKYGYPVETHEVETEDGYLLTLHRIPSGKIPRDGDRIPVLMVHGLFSSSADYIINGPGKALGYLLADEGYDVWMGNARGNFYSRKHSTLDPDESAFWKFSWNEIGRLDLPAMIDYVLDKTSFKKLHYIGHSQGTTSFFVMGSERPEYNDKILSMQALAPVAYMSHAKSPLLKYLAPFASSLRIILSMLGVNEMLSSNGGISESAPSLCVEDSEYLPLCENVLFLFAGYSPDQLNSTMLPTYMGHVPAGASSRQLVHYAQLYMSAKSRQYDHGSIANIFVYNSLFPPRYRLKKVTAPVALHYSNNDWLAEPVDVFQLHDELSNSVLYKVSLETFNHLDFIWGIDAKTLLYDKVIELMRGYDLN